MIVFRFFLEKIDIFAPFMDKKAKQMKYTPIKVEILIFILYAPLNFMTYPSAK